MTRLNNYPLLILVGAVGVALASSLLILVPTLNPPPEDIQYLLLYMGGSSTVTIGGVYIFYKRHWIGHLNSLRWTLLVIILITVVLIFANVYFTLQLMYISQHDMMLTTALLVFAGILAFISAMLIASSIIERIHHLNDASEKLAHGELHTRVEIHGNDELAQLAVMFNYMAKMLEETHHQQRQLEQSRRDLIAWASHDLRTPLAAIRAMNEAMLDGVVADAETTRRYRQQIHQELQHLSQLIDDLFDMAQLDAGHLKLNRKPTPLSQLIDTALASLNARANQKNITIQSHIPPELPLMIIAPDKIQRVLYNLLDNAIHHTPNGGTVLVSVVTEKSGVSVTVHNTGSVISADDLPHIFEAFYRGERSRSKDSSGYRGTGLGLAIARGFIEAHGGSIKVMSNSHAGTSFTFSLM